MQDDNWTVSKTCIFDKLEQIRAYSHQVKVGAKAKKIKQQAK